MNTKFPVFSVSGSEDKPAILFIHGFLGSYQEWDPVIKKINSKYRCISIGLPGHGGSPFPTNGYRKGYSICFHNIEILLTELNVKKCNLVGYSMGGRIALDFALHHPERIDNLVLESSSPGLSSEKERFLRREQDHVTEQFLVAKPFDEFLNRWYQQPLFNTIRKDPTIFKSMTELRLKNNPDHLAKALRAFGPGTRRSMWKELTKLKAPLYLIVGSEDKKYTEIAKKMAERCRISTLLLANGCGHNVHLENTDFFAAKLSEIIDKF